MQTFNFVGCLLRPYLDLGPFVEHAPLHVFGMEFEYSNLINETNLARINSIMMPSFREAAISQACAPYFMVDNPTKLDGHRQTQRYQELCHKIKFFKKISPKEKAGVLRLLNKMCLYGMTLFLSCERTVRWNLPGSETEFQIILANNILSLENRAYSFNINALMEIFQLAPEGSEAKINALYQLEIYFIKHQYNPSKAAYWAKLHDEELGKGKNTLDEFTYNQFMSRYHRVNGFIPQIAGDKDGVIREMGLAEDYAKKLSTIAKEKGQYQSQFQICAKEMLHRVYESRTKEALWLKDYRTAQERAEQFVDMCPFDTRARLNLGEILIEQEKIPEALIQYRAATKFGPPGTEVGRFMLGQCYEAMDHLEQAFDAYSMSLHYDPLGISSHEALLRVGGRNPSKVESQLIMMWSSEQTRELVAAQESPNSAGKVQPYQGRQFDESAMA
jgi:hypothetical protein